MIKDDVYKIIDNGKIIAFEMILEKIESKRYDEYYIKNLIIMHKDRLTTVNVNEILERHNDDLRADLDESKKNLYLWKILCIGFFITTLIAMIVK